MWQVAHGETPDSVRNHPALKGLTIPSTGQSGAVGALVTKTLVIAGDPLSTTGPNRPRGAMLRAYDKTDGKEDRRRLHAGAAVGDADDLRARRQTVHRRRGERRHTYTLEANPIIRVHHCGRR